VGQRSAPFAAVAGTRRTNLIKLPPRPSKANGDVMAAYRSTVSAMDIEQVARESRQRDAQLEAQIKDLLVRIQSLERLVTRIDAIENWRNRHEYEGHG